MFSRLTGEDNFDNLKQRLNPILKRTLRRQVLEYIKFTNRLAITQEFIPTTDEQKLYDIWNGAQRAEILELNENQRMHELEFCRSCTDYDI